jgi:hypothetical protein
MPSRDPFKLPFTRGLPRLPSLNTAFGKWDKKPFIGVTQGGSSRASPGAKVAATTAQFRPTK